MRSNSGSLVAHTMARPRVAARAVCGRRRVAVIAAGCTTGRSSLVESSDLSASSVVLSGVMLRANVTQSCSVTSQPAASIASCSKQSR